MLGVLLFIVGLVVVFVFFFALLFGFAYLLNAIGLKGGGRWSSNGTYYDGGCGSSYGSG